MPEFPTSCSSTEDVTITSDLFKSGVAVAQLFTYEYTYKPNVIVGLNTRDIFLVYSRPVGSGVLVHVLTDDKQATNLQSEPPCTKKRVYVKKNDRNVFLTDEAYFVKIGLKFSIENWVISENASFLFFNYTTD
ncbi:MAG: hypothetical protein QW303_00460 [Nitrososphaerota archaeon]